MRLGADANSSAGHHRQLTAVVLNAAFSIHLHTKPFYHLDHESE